MANNISNYLENKLLDHSLGKTSFTMPSTVYVALYTADPTDADTGTEVSGGSYARVQLLAASLNAASGGSSTTNADIVFPTATASWGTIVSIGLRDASTVGNLLWYGALTASKTVGSGDVFKILSGQLTITLD